MGSSPNGVANFPSGPAQPLKEFLASVGEAVSNLNTAIVGLDAVERGHEKPEALNISWNPNDRIAAARKSRRFVVEAVLVRVAEALSEFVSATSKLPRFDSLRGVWDNRTSRSEKFVDVAEATLGSGNYLIAGAALLIHWRNRVVHPHSRASLTPEQKRKLQGASDEIETAYAYLSVDRMLRDFEQSKPTLKEISSLVAMSIKIAREIDKEVNILSKGDLETLLEHYGLKDLIVKIEGETTPAKRHASVVRMLKSNAPGLVSAYDRLYSPVVLQGSASTADT